MKRVGWFLVVMILFVLLVSTSGYQAPWAHAQELVEPEPLFSGMPGRPLPDKPIPHHEPGHLSRAGNYHTEVTQLNELGMMETVQIAGVDAMAADGLDPLAGNYTMVNWDKILMSSYSDNVFGLQTYSATLGITPTLGLIPDSQLPIGNFQANDSTAGDLNADGQAEQIAAWIGESDRIFMSIGEMPGSLGRTTSKPAAVVHDDGSIDLLVRGYDDALWHRHSDDGLNWGGWNNDAGGFLLSAPSVASQADGQFDVFFIGTDNQVRQRHWDGSSWSSPWKQVGESEDWTLLNFWFGPTPELATPAAVARGNQIDLFRLGPDNTLRWLHPDNGTDLDAWEDLGGMLASGPGAVSLNAEHMQVFARGVDEALWHRTYAAGSWGPWQRLELNGMNSGVTIASAPTAVSPGSDQIDVYVRGSDDQLWRKHYDGTNWSGWNDDLGGELASGVAVAADPWTFFAQTKDGSLQSSNGFGWVNWGGLTPCCNPPFNTESVAITPPTGLPPLSTLLVDVETGYFKGDGREQIVLAYQASSDQIKIELYDIDEGFTPKRVLTSSTPIEGTVPRIATGDVNGDGIDEIGIAHLLDGYHYKVEVYHIEKDANGIWTGNLIKGRESPTFYSCSGGCNDSDDDAHWFAGTMRIVAGDFVVEADPHAREEFAVLSDWGDTRSSYCNKNAQWDTSYDLWVQLYIFDPDVDLGITECRPETDTNCPVRNLFRSESDDCNYFNNGQVTGAGLAAGDVAEDQYDEIIVTKPTGYDGDDWPDIYRNLSVYDARNVTPQDFNPALIGEISIPGWQRYSFLDTLAAGDLDRDLKDEIVFYSLDELQIYEFSNSTQKPVLMFELPLTSGDDPRSINLVTGDFTREGIRVGRPSYRVQNRVDTLVAVVNMPPKHRDLVQDSQGDYQLIESPIGECTPSPDSPNCTHAKYAKQDYTSSEQTIATTHAYEISAGLETEACAGGGVGGIASVKACVRTSVNATHGGNFEKSTEEIQSVNFKRKVIAANDDKVVYFGTPYGVWEYPILSGDLEGGSDQAFITVAFPLVSMTQYPDTSGGYYGGTCDETWFTAGHQPNNVWSYDPFGDINFPDYDPAYEPAYDAFEGDWAEGEITQLQTNANFGSIEFTHAISARVETEVKAEAKLGVVNVSGGFKAHVQGDYSHTSLKTDKLTNTEETTFSYFFAPQPDSAKFTTRVLFYRAKDNSLVMNYQAEPGRSASWQYYDKPDPAFILPWYGFPDPEEPQVPPCGEEQKLFSPDVVVNPPYASLGETVIISATVRNFSNEQTRDVLVRFYQGDPANDIMIGQDIIPSLFREAGPRTVSISWTATGVGEHKIFAVIDPEDAILEMHDGDDLINNNVAYGLVQLSAAGIADMGQAAEQPYDVISYTLASPGPIVSLYVPRASLSAVARFEVGGAEISAPTEELAGHMAFEVQAFQGSKFKMWDEPIKNFNLKPEDDEEHQYPPAVITVAYADEDIAGLIEANLTLYRFDGLQWKPATCTGYQIVRFPEENLIAVPVCKTGVFALSDKVPPIGDNLICLPLVMKYGGLAPQDGPDLVGSFSLSPDKQTFSAGDPVQIDVQVTNQGNVTAPPFWVDFYINPTAPPVAANTRWDNVCGLNPCLGLAWYVPTPLAAGQSVNLSSAIGSFSPEQSYWPGYFVNGTSDLYLYVDSWKPGIGLGAVVESNEANNRAERHGLLVKGSNPAVPQNSLPSWLQPRSGG